MNGGQGGFMPPDDGQWPNEGSAARGGTPYGQDPYGAPGAYGQQPYGQGAYGGGTQPQGGPYGDQYGAGTPSYGPGGEPPKQSRAGLIIGLAVVAVIVVIGAVAVVLGTSSGDDKSAAASSSSAPSASPSAADADVAHTITPPRAFGGYRLLTGSSARRLVQSMRKSSGDDKGTDAEIEAKAKIAIYTKNGDSTHQLVFIGLSSSDSLSLAQELKSSSPSEVADESFMDMGIGGDAKDFPAGPLGGVLRCGTGSVKGISAAGCAWADSSTTGMVAVPNTRNASALAGATLKLRNAAEH